MEKEGETPMLYCMLGDATDDPKNYEKAINHIKSLQLFGYWDIPMHKLISENYVSTKNQKGKQSLMIFLPEEVANSIKYELPKKILKKGSKRTTPIWTREYFHKIC